MFGCCKKAPSTDNNNSKDEEKKTNYKSIPNVPPLTNDRAKSGIGSSLLGHEIDYNDIQVDKQIAKGNYGVVYKALWKSGSATVAVKQVLITGEITVEIVSQFSKTGDKLSSLQHPNLVSFIGITRKGPLCLVSEFVTGFSLRDVLRGVQSLSSNSMSEVVISVATAMQYLHKNGVVHGNLAARNVLINENNEIKLSDFGIVPLMLSNQSSTEQVVKWLSPEAVTHKQCTVASDVWAFGVFVWEIMTLQEPFPNMDPLEVASKVATENLRLTIPKQSQNPLVNTGNGEVLIQLMKQCLQSYPTNRPNFDYITNVCKTQFK